MGNAIKTDTRQQAGKHVLKDEWWASHGVSTTREKLDFGDYMTDGSNVSVDTKRSIGEVAQNINGRNHDRFKRECVRARDAGYRLVILVENREGVKDLRGVSSWLNDHCRGCSHRRSGQCSPLDPTGKCPRHNTRKPIQGPRLMRAMKTMAERYGVDFRFCDPRDTARIICELLGVEYEQDADSSS